MENHRASNVVLWRIGEAPAHSRSMNALEVKIQSSSAMDEALKACPSGIVENKYIILYIHLYIYIILSLIKCNKYIKCDQWYQWSCTHEPLFPLMKANHGIQLQRLAWSAMFCPFVLTGAQPWNTGGWSCTFCGKSRLCKFSEEDLLHLFVQPVLQALINFTPGLKEPQLIKHFCREIFTVRI